MDPTLSLMKAYERCITNLSSLKEAPFASSHELSDTEEIIVSLLATLRLPNLGASENNLRIIYQWMLSEIHVLKIEHNEKKISQIILVIQSLLEPLSKYQKKNLLISHIQLLEKSIDEALRKNDKKLFLNLTDELNCLYLELT